MLLEHGSDSVNHLLCCLQVLQDANHNIAEVAEVNTDIMNCIARLEGVRICLDILCSGLD